MYQQYKLEGRNIVGLELDMVFETAIRIEQHLLGSQNRLSDMVFDAVADAIEFGFTDDDEPEGDADA